METRLTKEIVMRNIFKTLSITLVIALVFSAPIFAGENLRFSPLEWYGKDKYFDFGEFAISAQDLVWLTEEVKKSEREILNYFYYRKEEEKKK